MKTLMRCLLPVALPLAALATDVRTERVPEAGVQPQIAMAGDGTLHLVYLVGRANGSDVRHVCKKPGDSRWSDPVTVNSEPASAVAAGTIRGTQIAIGGEDTVHVVWNGAGHKARGRHEPGSLWYAQMRKGGPAFSPQRNLRGDTDALDGGASVAANAQGQVFVAWHGSQSGNPPGETSRRVFVITSADDGATFLPPAIANTAQPGVCACCSLKAFSPGADRLLVMFRAAVTTSERDVTLLRSLDGGRTFQTHAISPWKIAACPMSSMALQQGRDRTLAAWEKDGSVQFARLPLDGEPLTVAASRARHPAIAINGKGQTLVSWSIGTGWQKGGSFGWAVIDPDGKPTGETGVGASLAVWNFTAAYADGAGFAVLY